MQLYYTNGPNVFIIVAQGFQCLCEVEKLEYRCPLL